MGIFFFYHTLQSHCWGIDTSDQSKNHLSKISSDIEYTINFRGKNVTLNVKLEPILQLRKPFYIQYNVWHHQEPALLVRLGKERWILKSKLHLEISFQIKKNNL